MGYKTAYKEVMRSYEVSRAKAEELLSERKAALFKSFPRIEEIDQALLELGLSLAKLALAKDETGLLNTRSKAEALKQEKTDIMTANNVPTEYLTAVYKCSICSDTGHKPPVPGQLPVRCGCLSQRLIETYYSLSNIKGVLEEENFDTFDHRCFSSNIVEAEGLSPCANIQHVHRIATNFVQNFDSKFDNLLLYGRTGLGKTFICHCIAKDLLDTEHTVLYLTAPRMFKIIEDFRFSRETQDTPSEMLEAVNDVDLLILDDLGAEFVTVITSSALFDIINQRLLARKPTVISTNLSPIELERHYSERIVSRFTGYYQMIKFFGDDIRVKKKYGGKYENPA